MNAGGGLQGGRALGIALAVTLLVGASPAGAGTKYESKRFRVEPGEQSNPVVVKCPKGTHVVSGGVGMARGVGLVNQSMPLDLGDSNAKPDDGWVITLGNPGDIDLEEIASAHAICSTRTPTYLAQDFVATGEVTLDLACPIGSEATGAGGMTEGAMDSTYLRQWSPYEFGGSEAGAAQVVIQGSASAPEVTLAAICTDQLRLRYRTETFTIAEPYGSPDTVKCKRREQVVGGGGYVAAPGAGVTVRTEDSFPDDNGSDDDHKPDDAWGVSFLDDPFGSEPEGEVVAVCAR